MLDVFERLLKLAGWMGKNGKETLIAFLLITNFIFISQNHASSIQKDQMYVSLLNCKHDLEDEKTAHLKDVMLLNNNIQLQKDVELHAKDSVIYILKLKLNDVNKLIMKSNKIIKNNVSL